MGDFNPVFQTPETGLILEGSDGSKAGISSCPGPAPHYQLPWGVCDISRVSRPALPLLCIQPLPDPRTAEASCVWQLWLCFHPGKEPLCGSRSSNQTDSIMRQPSSFALPSPCAESQAGCQLSPHILRKNLSFFSLFSLLLPKLTDCWAEIINILSKPNPNISSQTSAFSGADAQTNLRGKCQQGKQMEQWAAVLCCPGSAWDVWLRGCEEQGG